MRSLFLNSNSLLIITYFGNFTDAAQKSLESLLENDIDVMLFADSEVLYKKNNFYFNNMNALLLKNIVEAKMNLKQNFKSYYKLCDFKVFFPFIFSDFYTKEYDYVGFCDLDVLYGDINSFIDSPTTEYFDVIGNRGHFTLFYSKYYNQLCSRLMSKNVFPVLKTILESKCNYAFDEFLFLHKLLKFDQSYYNIRWDSSISNCAVDLNYYTKEYYCSNRNTKVISIRKNKKTINVEFDNSNTEEVSYIHFQKREIPLEIFKKNMNFVINNNILFKDKLFYFCKIFLKRVMTKFTSEPILRKKYYSYKFVRTIFEK